jgi:hypothetical protein
VNAATRAGVRDTFPGMPAILVVFGLAIVLAAPGMAAQSMCPTLPVTCSGLGLALLGALLSVDTAARAGITVTPAARTVLWVAMAVVSVPVLAWPLVAPLLGGPW